MQGVLSCLTAAGAVSLALMTPVPAGASDGFGRHGSFHRPHFRPHRPIVRHRFGTGFHHRFGQDGFGRHKFNQHGFNPHRFGHHGFNHRGFWHHGFNRDGFKHDGFKHGFFPSSYLAGTSYPSNVTIVEQGAPASPLTTGTLPSVADLPAATGIRSQPTAEPAVYVINGTQRDMSGSIRRGGARSGGAKILTVDPSDAPNVPADVSTSGPRIIHLEVPAGR